jgi:hypothetical protein
MDWKLVQYEQQGYVKGASARIKDDDTPIVLVSNPKLINNIIHVWVALQQDTFTRFLININDIELI